MKEEDYFKTLISIIRMTGEEEKPEKIYQNLLNSIREFLGYSILSLRIYDGREKALRTLSTIGLGHEYHLLRGKIPVPGEEYDLSARAFSTGEPVYQEDIRKIAFPKRIREEVIDRYGIVSYLVIPIKYGKRSIGTLSVMTGRPFQFSAQVVGFLEMTGVIAGQIIVNSIRLKEQEKAKEQLDELLLFSRHLSGCLTPDFVIETAGTSLRKLFDLAGIGIFIVEKGVITKKYHNIEEVHKKRFEAIMEEAVKRVLRERKTLKRVIHLPDLDRMDGDEEGGAPFTLLTSTTEIPDITSATFSMIRKGEEAFPEEDLLFLDSLIMEFRLHLHRASGQKMTFELAIRDPLTRLYSRRYFNLTMTLELKKSERSSQPLSILMFDIDDFKAFNDRYGHLAGDRLLRWFSRAIKDSLRSTDVPCRLGGEEFSVILPSTGIGDAEKIAGRLMMALSRERSPLREKYPLIPTISIGIATCPEDGTALDEILTCADRLLYRAKREGKNRWLSSRSIEDGKE